MSHPAAILPKVGGPLVVEERTTPEPGPNEVLIEIKAVALNPIDYAQRDSNFPPVAVYPAVLGCDAAGIIAKVGSNVSSSWLTAGTRVVGLVSSFYQAGSPDYGAFQKYALAQFEAVIPIPDTLSFEQAAVCPLAALTAFSAWTTIGIPLDSRQDNQAVLIWGGASSVGTFAIQSARTLLGFKRIYVTASPKHHAYLKSLGADAVFDYRASDVVSQIVAAVERDGVELVMAHCVVEGGLQPTLDVLKQTRKGDKTAKVAHSPVLMPGHPTLENTEIKFTLPPMDKVGRDRHMYRCFHGWLQEGLKSGSVVPSPAVQVEEGGLEGLNAALDKLRAGVSGVKIVVPI